MLRNYGYENRTGLCGKDCFEEIDDEAQPEGKDEPRDSDSSDA